MKEVVNKIVQWHHDRNLIDGATDISQYKKLRSEFGEYSDNDAKGSSTIDDIGDMAVVVINIAERNGITGALESNTIKVNIKKSTDSSYRALDTAIDDLGFIIFSGMGEITESVVSLWETLREIATISGYELEECLNHAYNEIKDRKGKMINETFVKESDL